MSYRCTASCVATAYTIRYGSPKAGTGPGGASGVDAVDSESARGRGDAAGALGAGEGAPVSGGGSIAAWDVGALVGMTGSGSGGMSSSVRVSIVISFVSKFAGRSW